LTNPIISGNAPNPAGDLAHDAHSIAVLSIPPGSRVLDVGTGPGVVARQLSERSCRVVGIEQDKARASSAARWCERVIVGDVETLDVAAELPDGEFDVLLFLDVLEHLRNPADGLERLLPLLGPSGTVVVSIPNVTHAAVRLQLLAGKFEATDEGLLDRTHLHFFDREAAESLINGAGLAITERLRVRRGLTETEIEVDPEKFPPEVLSAVFADTDAETYQFIFRAVPADRAGSRDEPSLASALQTRLEATQDVLRDAESYVRHLEGELERLRFALDETELERSRSEAQRAEVEMALKERIAELEVLHGELRHLQADIEVKEAYTVDLTAELGRLHGHIQAQAVSQAALEAELQAIKRRKTYRALTRIDRRLEAHPLVRRTVLRVLTRLGR
jgi:2-polyprenyl-3-methyl-5-hydroxy-6-metoxy-1,4-benzoquinol methylase